MGRIAWDQIDKETLIEKAFELLLTRPGLGWIELINKAQDGCPSVGKRKITSTKMVEWFQPALKERIKKAKKENEELIREVIELRKMLTPDQVLELLLDEEIKNKFGHRILANLTFDELFDFYGEDQILDAVSEDKVLAKIGGLLMQLLHRPKIEIQGPRFNTPEAVPEKEEKKIRLPRIVIVGPISKQRTILNQRFSNRAILMFCNGDDKNFSASADLYIIWTRFASHAINNKIMSVAKDKSRVFLSVGGMESLIERIEEALTKVKV